MNQRQRHGLFMAVVSLVWLAVLVTASPNIPPEKQTVFFLFAAAMLVAQITGWVLFLQN